MTNPDRYVNPNSELGMLMDDMNRLEEFHIIDNMKQSIENAKKDGNVSPDEIITKLKTHGQTFMDIWEGRRAFTILRAYLDSL